MLRIPLGRYVIAVDPVRAMIYLMCFVVVGVIWWISRKPVVVRDVVKDCEGSECAPGVAEPSESETESEADAKSDVLSGDMYGPARVGKVAGPKPGPKPGPCGDTRIAPEPVDVNEDERAGMTSDMWTATDPAGPESNEPELKGGLMGVEHDGKAYMQ